MIQFCKSTYDYIIFIDMCLLQQVCATMMSWVGWWVEFDDELSWLFTNKFGAPRYMKVKRMGITKILRRIWLFPANKTESSESFSKQPTQLIVKLHSSLWHIFVTNITLKPQNSLIAPSTRHEKWADWTDHVCLMINCKKGASGYTVNLLIYCE